MRNPALPAGYQALTPYLLAEDVDAFLAFAGEAFAARTVERLRDPDGTTRHAEVEIGGARLMVGRGPAGCNAQGAILYHYVADADGSFARAVEAGAAVFQELREEFYGDRVGAVDDPFGNQWWIATRVRDLDTQERQRRMHSDRG